MSIKLKRLLDRNDIAGIVEELFETSQKSPVLKTGYYNERQIWDFKSEVPGSGKKHQHAWAIIAKHVLAFHNSEGGILIFGIRDEDFQFIGASNYCDSAQFNNGIRKYVGDLFHVTFSREFIQKDQSYLGIAVVPARGARIVKFASDAPKYSGNIIFSKGDIAVREGDSSKVYRGQEAESYLGKLALPRVGRGFYVDEDGFRILSPEYRSFVYRQKLCEDIMTGLQHPRAAVTSLFGIGGVGKTALATWAVIEAYRDNMFDYIVSVTAKDRELTARGTLPTEIRLTTYEELLDTILRVLGFEDALEYEDQEKENFVTDILQDGGNGLIYVDNLETIDDVRILQFLDNLPLGCRAIVTSRIDRVRVAAYPIQVGPLEGEETFQFVKSLYVDPKLAYLTDFNERQVYEFGGSCNGIPLAMRWIAAKSQSANEALQLAKQINSQSRTNEELLEFSFRRIFDSLTEIQRKVMKILSIYSRPMPLEEILICADESYQTIGDTLAEIENSALIEMAFDDTIQDSVYSLLPITRSFVYGDVRKEDGFESEVRDRMQNWLEASEIKDPTSRAIARGIRQARISNEDRLLQLAEQAMYRGQWLDAGRLFEEAIKRNPHSWVTHFKYAEFLKKNDLHNLKLVHHDSLQVADNPCLDRN